MSVRKNRFVTDPDYPTVLESLIMISIVLCLILVLWQIAGRPSRIYAPDCSLCHAAPAKPFDVARVKTKRPHAQTDKERKAHARAILKELEELSR